MTTSTSEITAEFKFVNVKKANADAKSIESNLEKLTKTTDNFENFINGLTPVMDKLAAAVDRNTLAVSKSNKAYGMAIGQMKAYAKGTQLVYKNLDKATKGLEVVDTTINRSAAQANRFNFGNINAQIQDIIVTSQMGMKPLTIALQQGTQLVYILQQSKAPMKDFVAGLKSFLSPLTLAVVGLTALTAVVIQAIDWNKVLGNTFLWLGKVIDSPNLTAIGNKYRQLADDMKKAEEAAKGFSKYFDTDTLEKDIKDLDFEISLIGKTDYEKNYATAFRKEEERVNKLLKENKDITKDEMDFMGKMIPVHAKTYADKMEQLTKAKEKDSVSTEKSVKLVDDLTKSYENLVAKGYQDIDDIQFERSIQGMSEYDTIVAKTTRDLEKQIEAIRNRAEAEGINTSFLNDAESKIKDIAEAKARETLETEKLKKELETYNSVMDYGSSLTKGFVSDLKNGLKQGQSAWESFTNAVLNMLDKIQDKLMDLAIDTMFDSMKSSGMFKSLISSGMSLFSGASGASSAATNTAGGSVVFANPNANSVASVLGVKSALGGVWERGIKKFATGGVVSSPTMFGTRSGLGLMGEAGPEAIMPLRRGPDGSLGVKVDGVSGSPVVVNVINNSNAQAHTEQRQTSHGVEIDVLIDEMVAKKLGTNGTASNTALRAYSNQQLVMR